MSGADQLAWDDVASAASKIFHVWVDGGELEWAREAWQHLADKGMTGGAGVLDDTAARLRLVTLGRVYREFCGAAWDENPETSLRYLAEDMKIDPIALGILAGGLELHIEDDDLEEAALFAVTDSFRGEIFECLRRAYSDVTRLYSRMWHTRSPSMDQNAIGNEFDLTGPNSVALEYVTNGFQL